jgi:hypothetical protein
MSVRVWELETRANSGSGNNAANPAWGQAGTQLLRGSMEAVYGPGDTPRQYPDALGPRLLDPNGQIDLIIDVVKATDNIDNSYGANELSAGSNEAPSGGL